MPASASLPPPDDNVASNHCDWRLGRAARQLVAESLGPALGYHDQHDDSTPSIWKLLEQAVDPAVTLETCPLIASKDVQRYAQESARVIPAMRRPPRAQSQRTSQQLPAVHWFQCGLCHKTFVSRYYLDRHFNNRHHEWTSDSFNVTKSAMLCPALDYCSFLSLPACHDRAHELEPEYYDPERRRQQKQSKYTTLASLSSLSMPYTTKRTRSVACRPLELEQANERCRRVVEACFSHNRTLHYLLTDSWCRRSCEDRWMRLLQVQSSNMAAAAASQKQHQSTTTTWLQHHYYHPLGHDWWSEQQWSHHSRHTYNIVLQSHAGRLAVLLLIVIALVATLTKLVRRRRPRPASRLLQKQPRLYSSLRQQHRPTTNYWNLTKQKANSKKE